MKRLFIIIIIALISTISIYKSVMTGNFITGNKDHLIERNADSSTDLPSTKENTQSKENAQTKASFAGYINLTASNAILFDIHRGSVLFEKNSKERCYPASTTKILTALIAIENCDLHDEVTVGDEANFPPVGSSKAGIRYGEKLTMEQLLNCMLIPSGNDAAYTIAVNAARKISGNMKLGNREAVQFFCEFMNKRAKELGAKDSRFVNPDGFHNIEHYTTAYDLCLIAREAVKHKEFRDIICKDGYKIPDVKIIDKNGKQHLESRILINTNKLILKNNAHYYKFATGGKTGHTDEAGYCLVSSAEADGKDILAVIMNSTKENVWSDSTKLLEFGIEK